MKNLGLRDIFIYTIVGVLSFILSYSLIQIVEKKVTILEIEEQGVQAKLYAQKSVENATTVLLIGGGEWGYQWAGRIAEKGFVAVSIPYYGKKELPQKPEDISLDYFERALSIIKSFPEVDSSKIVAMGASRNAELALLLGSKFIEDLHGIVAIAPSSVVWCNRVLPFNSDSIKPSWRYQGRSIPFIPMEKIKPQTGEYLETIPYWIRGLQKLKDHPDAAIEVELISGPILLFSGKDDQVWPSAKMADMIEDRLLSKGFKFYFENNQYHEAGHLISRNMATVNENRFGQLQINNESMKFEFGGTIAGDKKAIADIEKKVFELLRRMAEQN